MTYVQIIYMHFFVRTELTDLKARELVKFQF